MSQPEFSVYMHVPYCRVQCPYCTFFTVLRPESPAPMTRFLRAVDREWQLRVQPRLQRGDRLVTLYLGGGTPSDVPIAALTDLLATWGRRLPGGLAGVQEVTVECNPESAPPASLDALAAVGVSRISLGVQAMDAKDLLRLGRASTVEQNRAALAAVGARFENWSADAIIGIPGSDALRLDATLAALMDAGAPHLSFYCLEMPAERARRLGDPQTPRSENRKAAWYERASAAVTARGYEHYEISSAARPGFASRHNRGYWTGRPYLGLGPGAHSFDPGTRGWNRPDLDAYLTALESGGPPPGTQESLDAGARERESIDLALRQRTGLELAGRLAGLPASFLEDLETAGLGFVARGRLRLSPRGWLVSDSIVLQILALLDAVPADVDKPLRPSLHWPD